jgi:hypothetical protein
MRTIQRVFWAEFFIGLMLRVFGNTMQIFFDADSKEKKNNIFEYILLHFGGIPVFNSG